MNTYALEMMLAVLLVAVGIVLAWPGETFAIPHYASVSDWIPEREGGALLAVIGGMRVAAILRNGRSRYTPVLRILGCSIGAGFWASVFFAVEASSYPAGIPLILPVSITAICFELYSALRGGADAHALDSLGLRQRKASGRQNARKAH
jgi:peptidoglycan/LPS O-acetylase OafA/YrhL